MNEIERNLSTVFDKKSTDERKLTSYVYHFHRVYWHVLCDVLRSGYMFQFDLSCLDCVALVFFSFVKSPASKQFKDL